MALLTALLPVEQGGAVEAALRQAAMTMHAGGDERSLAQVKADILVERVTGQVRADAVSVQIGLVMTSDALLGRTEEPARLAGMGPIPATLARQIACRASHADTADATGPSTEAGVEVGAAGAGVGAADLDRPGRRDRHQHRHPAPEVLRCAGGVPAVAGPELS